MFLRNRSALDAVQSVTDKICVEVACYCQWSF